MKPAGTTIVALVLAILPGLRAQDYGNNQPPPEPTVSVPLTAEEKGALHAIDVRLAAVEALVSKIDDADYQKSVADSVKDMKRRRASLEKRFDPMTYESLMQSVIGRYQVVQLWLRSPPVPAAAKTAPTTKAAVTGKPAEKNSGAR